MAVLNLWVMLPESIFTPKCFASSELITVISMTDKRKRNSLIITCMLYVEQLFWLYINKQCFSDTVMIHICNFILVHTLVISESFFCQVAIFADKKIIVDLIVGKQGGKQWTGFIWLRIWTSSGLLWITFGFHKRWENSMTWVTVSFSRTLLHGISQSVSQLGR
jgi:apolipoprotein N-acyltransferase